MSAFEVESSTDDEEGSAEFEDIDLDKVDQFLNPIPQPNPDL